MMAPPSTMVFPSFLAAILLLLHVSFAEESVAIYELGLSIEPDSKHLHFIQVNLEAPGYIDLSALEFATVDDGHDDAFDIDEDELEDDDMLDDLILEEDDDWVSPPEKKITQLDVVVVHIPDDCATIEDEAAPHCDFTEVGVGRIYSQLYGLLDEPYWCCTDDEVALGLCDNSVAGSYGRMMMNLTAFEGSHRFIEVPPYGQVTSSIRYGKIEELQHSGKYAIILANCYKGAGRKIVVQGDIKVKSSGTTTALSTAPARFDVAMKSFAKNSLEKAEENQDNKKKENSSKSGLGLTFALIVFGIAGVALAGTGRLGNLGVALSHVRGYRYNSLELQEMDGGDSPENNYVPIASN